MPLNKPFIGEFQIQKGNLEGGLQVNLWDAVRTCKGTECRLAYKCKYAESKRELRDVEHLPCRIERKYLVQVLDPFLQLIDIVKDPFLMNWVGMHLIPMYVDLCQLKMEKLKVDNITYTDKKGEKKIDPIYDEVRKAHREILSACKTMGIYDLAKKAGFLKLGGRGSVMDPELQMDGDGDAYEEMAKGG
ncbi:MAG: hypothetical protein WA151_11375 [Desulfatirhabdiaceae bacterium]